MSKHNDGLTPYQKDCALYHNLFKGYYGINPWRYPSEELIGEYIKQLDDFAEDDRLRDAKYKRRAQYELENAINEIGAQFEVSRKDCIRWLMDADGYSYPRQKKDWLRHNDVAADLISIY